MLSANQMSVIKEQAYGGYASVLRRFAKYRQ